MTTMASNGLIKLDEEDFKLDGQLHGSRTLGTIQKWGHPSGRGNFMYVYVPADGRPPGLATSLLAARSALLGANTVSEMTDDILKTEDFDYGVLEQVYLKKERRRQWRWRTKDGRLNGTAPDRLSALMALQEVIG